MRTPWAIRLLSMWMVSAVTGAMLLPYVAAAEEAPLTLEALRRQFPDARFVQVSPDVLQMAMVQAPVQASVQAVVGSTNGVLQAGLVQTNALSNATARAASNSEEEVDLPPRVPEQGVHDARPHHHSDGSLLFDLTNMDWGGGDGDVVLYVLIGVVVVAAFVIYTADYIYHLTMHPGEQEYWWNLDLHSAWITGSGERGYLVGAKLSTGFVARDAHAGLSLEAGYLDVELDVDDSAIALGGHGGYGMAGPHIHWLWDTESGNPSQLAVELLAGGTSADHIGLLSMARLSLSLGLGGRGRLGFMLGSLYTDVQPDEGIVRDYDNFSLIIGGQIGLRL